MENMTLNKMQLTIIEQIIDSNAGLSSFELFSKLKRSQSQISYTLTSLVKEGLIEKKKTFYFISKYVHAQYLKDLYLSTRINLGRILSNNRIKFLTAICCLLLFLTAVTVWVSRYDFNEINIAEMGIIMALFVATVKATIVGLYFMHLRWDRPFIGFIFIGSILQ